MGKHKFVRGQTLYVLDYIGADNTKKPIVVHGTVLHFDNKLNCVTVALYNDVCETYSQNDFGRLLFKTREEAVKALNLLPKAYSYVYHVIKKKVYKKLVLGIVGHYTQELVYDLFIVVHRGTAISIKEMGKTIFFTKGEAKKSIK